MHPDRNPDRNRSVLKSALFLSVAALSTLVWQSAATAQDSNYWGITYGSESALRGGAVVGTVRDPSAAFYNPGALGFIDNSSLSISANAFRYETLKHENGAGTGSDLESEELTVFPTMIGGVHKPESWGVDHTISYTLLTRNRFKASASERIDVRDDVLTNIVSDGLEDFTGQHSYSKDVNELWGGLGYGYKINSWLGVGFTNFLALRDEKFSSNSIARATNVENQGQVFSSAASTLLYDYDYTNLRLLWKAGLMADLGAVKFGLAVTTPSVHVWGDGEVNGDISAVNVDSDGDGLPNSLIANDRQDGLNAKYKTPLSIAAGMGVELTDYTRMYLTTEWFDSRGDYAVVEPRSREIVRPIGTTSLIDSRTFFDVRDSAGSVFNAGTSIEHDLTDTFMASLAFRTDFSSSDERENFTDRAITSLDLYHVTLGGKYKREKSDVTMGVEWSFSDSRDREQFTNYESANESNFLFGDSEATEMSYNAFTVFLGYTYHFG